MARLSAFAPEHLPAIVALCEREGWTTLSVHPARTARSLLAPGVLSVVAIEGEELVGFAQALTDGHIQAYLCRVLVAPHLRGRGIGKQLVQAALDRSGAARMDLLASDGTEAFYSSFPGSESWGGYRLPAADL